MYYDTGDWNKKVHWVDVINLVYTKYKGWDKINQKPIEVEVNYEYKITEDMQEIMEQWADDNNNGYFFNVITYTHFGTGIIRNGDIINIKFTFQKKIDAIAFKLRWA